MYTIKIPEIKSVVVINTKVKNAGVLPSIFPSRSVLIITSGLIDSCDKSELRAIIAHELGHVIHYHILWGLFTSNFMEIVPIWVFPLNCLFLLYGNKNNPIQKYLQKYYPLTFKDTKVLIQTTQPEIYKQDQLLLLDNIKINNYNELFKFIVLTTTYRYFKEHIALAISREEEYEADKFAAEMCGKQNIVNVLKCINKNYQKR